MPPPHSLRILIAGNRGLRGCMSNIAPLLTLPNCKIHADEETAPGSSRFFEGQTENRPGLVALTCISLVELPGIELGA